MAMSNLYSKIAPKPPKRLSPDMNTQTTVSQTNQWINGMKNDGIVFFFWVFNCMVLSCHVFYPLFAGISQTSNLY